MKYASKVVAVIAALLVFYTGIITLVQFIPSSSIKTNVQKSAEFLRDEGQNPQFGPLTIFRLDTYTDAIALNEAYVSDSKHPVESGMLNWIWVNFEEDDRIDNLESVINDNYDGLYKYSYSRNWNGHQVFIRPLLLFTDIYGIRIINIIIMVLMTAFLLYGLWTKVSKESCVIFALLFLGFNFMIIPLCMQYMTCICIAMLGMIIIIWSDKIRLSLLNASIFFLILGSVCNFFDWFTVPQLTYGLPFIIYMLMKHEGNVIKNIVFTGIAWCVGYGITLLAKWSIATVLTDYNCFTLAFDAVNLRLSSTMDSGTEITTLIAIKRLASMFFMKGLSLVAIVAFVISFYMRKTEVKEAVKQYWWLLIIALFVPAWFLLIKNHSFGHFSLFTWRAFFVTIYAVALYLYYTVIKVWLPSFKITK